MSGAQWGHRLRFGLIADEEMPIVTDKILWYGFGVAGRIFDLPPQYQDAIARSVTTAHPRSFNRRAMLYCLVNGRFKSSTHPALVGLSEEEVLTLCRSWERGYRLRRRREREEERERSLLQRKRVIR